MIEKKLKSMNKSIIIRILAMSDENLFNFYGDTKLNESSDMTNT
mgnify:CR=1 FL=1